MAGSATGLKEMAEKDRQEFQADEPWSSGGCFLFVDGFLLSQELRKCWKKDLKGLRGCVGSSCTLWTQDTWRELSLCSRVKGKVSALLLQGKLACPPSVYSHGWHTEMMPNSWPSGSYQVSLATFSLAKTRLLLHRHLWRVEEREEGQWHQNSANKFTLEHVRESGALQGTFTPQLLIRWLCSGQSGGEGGGLPHAMRLVLTPTGGSDLTHKCHKGRGGHPLLSSLLDLPQGFIPVSKYRFWYCRCSQVCFCFSRALLCCSSHGHNQP